MPAEHQHKLESISLFEGLGSDCLARIADLVTEVEVEPGHVLTRENDAGAGLFLIEDGTVVVSTRRGDIELGPGECVGELALLDDRGKHAARARAKTHLHALAIDRAHFMELLGAEPTIALSLLRVMAHRLSDAIHK